MVLTRGFLGLVPPVGKTRGRDQRKQAIASGVGRRAAPMGLNGRAHPDHDKPNHTRRLDRDAPAALRDLFVTDLNDLSSEAAACGLQALTAKNTLLSAHAERVESAFQRQQLSKLTSSGPKAAWHRCSRRSADAITCALCNHWCWAAKSAMNSSSRLVEGTIAKLIAAELKRRGQRKPPVDPSAAA
jgi:hypothetical protein